MSITYKTVINNAIEGFNKIQDAIYTNSGQLSTASTTSPASVTSIINSLNAATFSSATVSGTGDVDVDIYKITNTNQKDENITDYSIGGKNISSYPYYIKLSAKGTTKTLTLSDITTTAGLIKGGTITINKSVGSVTANEKTQYIGLKAGSTDIIGGDLSSLDGSVTGNNVVLSDTDTSGISVSGSGTVSISAIKKVSTEGYIRKGLDVITNSEDVSSKIKTKYITGLTLPTSKALSLTTNGTTTVNNNSAGAVIWDGWEISISHDTSEDILVFNPKS